MSANNVENIPSKNQGQTPSREEKEKTSGDWDTPNEETLKNWNAPKQSKKPNNEGGKQSGASEQKRSANQTGKDTQDGNQKTNQDQNQQNSPHKQNKNEQNDTAVISSEYEGQNPIPNYPHRPENEETLAEWKAEHGMSVQSQNSQGTEQENTKGSDKNATISSQYQGQNPIPNYPHRPENEETLGEWKAEHGLSGQGEQEQVTNGQNNQNTTKGTGENATISSKYEGQSPIPNHPHSPENEETLGEWKAEHGIANLNIQDGKQTNAGNGQNRRNSQTGPNNQGGNPLSENVTHRGRGDNATISSQYQGQNPIPNYPHRPENEETLGEWKAEHGMSAKGNNQGSTKGSEENSTISSEYEGQNPIPNYPHRPENEETLGEWKAEHGMSSKGSDQGSTKGSDENATISSKYEGQNPIPNFPHRPENEETLAEWKAELGMSAQGSDQGSTKGSDENATISSKYEGQNPIPNFPHRPENEETLGEWKAEHGIRGRAGQGSCRGCNNNATISTEYQGSNPVPNYPHKPENEETLGEWKTNHEINSY